LKSFDHLSDIEFPHRAGPIDLILGVQYSHLHAEHEVRQGLPFQPVAKRTKLGWHVIGPDNVKGSTVSYLNFARKINMERFYDFETVGVRAPDCDCPEQTMSRDGKIAMELFESSCKLLDGRYVIGHHPVEGKYASCQQKPELHLFVKRLYPVWNSWQLY
jgi:hypothetical protein